MLRRTLKICTQENRLQHLISRSQCYSTGNAGDTEPVVNIPMIRKMERICKNYIDQLESGGKEYRIQNFIIMYIFASTTNTQYRTKLFDLWPTYLEDFAECKSIMGYRYPETLCEAFFRHHVEKPAKILDLACGPGNVAAILRENGYSQVDGLDPSSGLLTVGRQKGFFNNTYCCYLTPHTQTPISDESYDAVLCSAGMFPGSIVPQAFTEILRITKKGGVIAWNIADGYQGFNEFFKSYDEIYQGLIQDKKWEELAPVEKTENMLFEDAGYTYVMRKL